MTRLLLRYRRGCGFDVLVYEPADAHGRASQKVVATVGAAALALFIADASRELATLATHTAQPFRALLGAARKVG